MKNLRWILILSLLAAGSSLIYAQTYNTALGVNALILNTTGYRNVAVGDSALGNNTTGYGNSATGYKALKGNAGGYFNTAVGGFSLTKTTMSYENTAVGYKAQELATGSKNVAMGYQSFHKGTGTSNVAIGNLSMHRGGGLENTAIGYSAFQNSSGSHNTAIGSRALSLLSAKSGNTAVGYKAQVDANGMSNTSLGYRTLERTTGNENIALGYKAMFNAGSGNRNIGIGYQSLLNITSGRENTGLGTYVLQSLSSGEHNIAMGYGAGRDLTTGSQNIIFGRETHVSSSYSYNIIIGYRSAALMGDNNIIIGKKISLPAGTSNGLNIGGVLFGSGLQSELPGNPTAQPANGKIGINVVNPQYTLDVNGTIRAKEVLVNLEAGADFVFEDNYSLMKLDELDEYVKTNKHLPDVAPAAVMESEGISVSEMNALLLRKIEELTLYIIAQDKRIGELERKK
ncbi:MAG: hypothetical protein LBR81_05380 [Prevotellaceae bacterium]|nr:hypothetical protein [Prevotellaceae bacterium]